MTDAWGTNEEGGIDLRVFESRLTLSFPRLTTFPDFPGITLRGLLGHALLDYWGDRDGGEELFRWFFKPPDPVPAPFMIDCRPGAGQGHALSARLRLFGKGISVFTDVVEALSARAGMGFGAEKTPYALFAGAPEEVASLPWSREWAGTGAAGWRVEFVSPAQLFRGGSSLAEADFLPLALAESAARRLERLAKAYGCPVEGLLDAARADAAGAGILRYSLRKVDIRRMSGIDGHEVAAGGLSGWIELRGNPALERWLAMGARLGVGKKIASGNGRVAYFSL